MSIKVKCHCGCGDITPHELGNNNCYRETVSAPKGPFSKQGTPYWVTTDNCPNEITEYTLKHQRGYSLHKEGIWSRPKSRGSINSIEDYD